MKCTCNRLVEARTAELINDYIKKGLIVPGEITINLLLKKIRFYEAQGQKKIIIVASLVVWRI